LLVCSYFVGAPLTLCRAPLRRRFRRCRDHAAFDVISSRGSSIRTSNKFQNSAVSTWGGAASAHKRGAEALESASVPSACLLCRYRGLPRAFCHGGGDRMPGKEDREQRRGSLVGVLAATVSGASGHPGSPCCADSRHHTSPTSIPSAGIVRRPLPAHRFHPPRGHQRGIETC
jgi:hypothetical protein